MLEDSQRGSRRERRRQEVHERIVVAAVQLFDTHGVADTRIDDICEHADLAQKTFFNHFPTKQHLFREIAQAFVGNVCALVEEARKQPGSTCERLAMAFRLAGDLANALTHHRACSRAALPARSATRLAAPRSSPSTGAAGALG